MPPLIHIWWPPNKRYPHAEAGWQINLPFRWHVRLTRYANRWRLRIFRSLPTNLPHGWDA